jgi:hypothetical protein
MNLAKQPKPQRGRFGGIISITLKEIIFYGMHEIKG